MEKSEISRPLNTSSYLTISFLFTDKDVGAIIGRSGVKIREIKAKTQCRLVFHGKMGCERVLSITGNQEDLPLAVFMVANALLREPSTARDLDETGDYDKTVILLFLLPHNTCGAVIGKQGSVVKSIVSDTGAKILVLFEKTGRSENGGIAKIQGSPEKVKDAVMKITDIVKTFPGAVDDPDKNSLSPKISQQNSSTLSGMSHKTSQTLYIDNKIARVIVGRAGTTINELRKISKAFIQVSNTDNRNESSLVISGDPSSVAVAFHLIELRINSQFSNTENWIDGRGNNYPGSGSRSRINNYVPNTLTRTNNPNHMDSPNDTSNERATTSE